MLDNASGKMVYTVIAMRTANEEREMMTLTTLLFKMWQQCTNDNVIESYSFEMELKGGQ